MTITSRSDIKFSVCLLGIYFEIRDGMNQSANLLGVFCELCSKGSVFRSSGQNMWLKLHQLGRFRLSEEEVHINYTAKPMNITGLYSFINLFS